VKKGCVVPDISALITQTRTMLVQSGFPRCCGFKDVSTYFEHHSQECMYIAVTCTYHKDPSANVMKGLMLLGQC
jgi:hypothetical protein